VRVLIRSIVLLELQVSAIEVVDHRVVIVGVAAGSRAAITVVREDAVFRIFDAIVSIVPPIIIQGKGRLSLGLFMVQPVITTVKIVHAPSAHMIGKVLIPQGQITLLAETILFIQQLLQSVLHHHFLKLPLFAHQLFLVLSTGFQPGGLVLDAGGADFVDLDVAEPEVVRHDLLL